MEWDRTRIRALRVALRLPQDKFANQLGAAPKTICNWEQGKHPPGLALMRALDEMWESTSPEQKKRFFLSLSAMPPDELAEEGRATAVDRAHVPVSAGPFASSGTGCEPVQLEPIRDALSYYPRFDAAPALILRLDEAQQLTDEVHRRYQAADYARAASLLPGLIRGMDGLVVEGGGSIERAALVAQSSVYEVTAKLVTKVGDPQLAWLAADRAINAAQRAEDPLRFAAAAYQVVCAFLERGQLAEAERIAVTTADTLVDSTPLGLSLRGALTLIASIIAGRRNDRVEALERLDRARQLSTTLGHDGNHGWTAFGPTNVQIHSVSVAVELGDVDDGIARAEDVHIGHLPAGLLSRRAQVHIDCAWAYAQRHQDAASVGNLLEAEAVAPQTLRYNLVVRALLPQMLERERRSATPGLRALAQRAGVLQ